jgi:hypothetical protein
MTSGSEQGTGLAIALALSNETTPMKTLTATALLLTLGAVALAKPIPIERSLALMHAEISIGSDGAMHENIGSVGAMRERDYFGAQAPFNAFALPIAAGPIPQDAPSPVVPLISL